MEFSKMILLFIVLFAQHYFLFIYLKNILFVISTFYFYYKKSFFYFRIHKNNFSKKNRDEKLVLVGLKCKST